jgi:hypothetical protein
VRKRGTKTEQRVVDETHTKIAFKEKRVLARSKFGGENKLPSSVGGEKNGAALKYSRWKKRCNLIHTYVVLFSTNSVVVKHSEIIHSHDVALIRSLVQPLDGLHFVLLNAHAVRVHQAKVA